MSEIGTEEGTEEAQLVQVLREPRTWVT